MIQQIDPEKTYPSDDASELETSPEVIKAIETDARFLRVLGGAGTGKSYVVAKRIGRLLYSGCDPSQILVIVSNQNAAHVLKKHLESDALNFSDIIISTMQDHCISILSSPEAMEYTGRSSRVINSLEELFLREDLKMLGIRPKRIREILNYFYRELTELGDEDDGFIQDEQEKDLYTALQAHLTVWKAMSPHELSNLAYRHLQGNSQARIRASYQHVLVDDYQNLSKASQLITGLLSLESITVTGNPFQTQGSRESYPYREGLMSFGKEQDLVEITLSQSMRCPQRIAAAGNALMLAEASAAGSVQDIPALLVSYNAKTPLGDVSVFKWNDPDAERKGIASMVKERLSNGQGMVAKDVLVIVPNRSWGRLFTKELDLLSIQHEDCYCDEPLVGNPQQLDASLAMQSYTLLTLAANPNDIVAWRSWCGYGDYLLNSNAWNNLMLYASSRNLNAIAALKEVAECAEAPFVQAEVLADAYRRAQRLLAQCAGKTGEELIEVLCQGGGAASADFVRLIEPIDANDTANDFYERARLRFVDPWFQTQDSVRIASLSTAMSLEASLVVFLGMVDGFLPSSSTFGISSAAHTQDRRRARERRAFYNILSRSNNELILSYFQKADLDVAERLSMEISRIRVEKGNRVAILAQSQFITEMGDTAPKAIATL